MNPKNTTGKNVGEYILAVAKDLGIDLQAPRVKRRSIARRNAIDLINNPPLSSTVLDDDVSLSQAASRYNHRKSFPINLEVISSQQSIPGAIEGALLNRRGSTRSTASSHPPDSICCDLKMKNALRKSSPPNECYESFSLSSEAISSAKLAHKRLVDSDNYGERRVINNQQGGLSHYRERMLILSDSADSMASYSLHQSSRTALQSILLKERTRRSSSVPDSLCHHHSKRSKVSSISSSSLQLSSCLYSSIISARTSCNETSNWDSRTCGEHNELAKRRENITWESQEERIQTKNRRVLFNPFVNVMRGVISSITSREIFFEQQEELNDINEETQNMILLNA